MPSTIIPSVIMPSTIIPSVIMPSGIIPSVSIHSITMIFAVMASVITANVGAPGLTKV